MESDIAFIWMRGGRVPREVELPATVHALVVFAVCEKDCDDIAEPKIVARGAGAESVFVLTASQWDYAESRPGVGRRIADNFRSATGGRPDRAIHVLFYLRRGAEKKRLAYGLARISVPHCAAGSVATFAKVGASRFAIGCVLGVERGSSVNTSECVKKVLAVGGKKHARPLIAAFLHPRETVDEKWVEVVRERFSADEELEVCLLRRRRRDEEDTPTPSFTPSLDWGSASVAGGAGGGGGGGGTTRIPEGHLYIFHND